MSAIPTNTILYFFTQGGCTHCTLQRPVVDEYRQKHAGELFVYELDANKHPGVDDWSLGATPAFALKVNSILMGTREGVMSLAQIEKFVERGVAGKEADNEDRPARNSRRPAQGRRKASGASGDQTTKRKRGSGAGADDAADDGVGDGDDRTSRASAD